uniref:Uncharacterized protein n=1 Tax=Arundo donax TaxID=35708 RepID=A0A0A8ZFG9_ARUDO
MLCSTTVLDGRPAVQR